MVNKRIHRLFDTELIKDISYDLENRLARAAIKREILDVTGLYGIGKTHALLEFANQYKLLVVVPDRMQATAVSKYADDSGLEVTVVHVDALRDSSFKGAHVVIDTGVDHEMLEERYQVQVVTGYYVSQFRKTF